MSESEQKAERIATIQLNAARRKRRYRPMEVRPPRLDPAAEAEQKRLEAEMLCQPVAPTPDISMPKLDDESILVELHCRMTTTKGVILNLPFSQIVGSANKAGRIYAFTHQMQRLMRDFSGYVVRETHNYALEKEPQNDPAKKEEFEQLDRGEMKKPDISGLLSRSAPFAEPPIATHEPKGPTSMEEIK